MRDFGKIAKSLDYVIHSHPFGWKKLEISREGGFDGIHEFLQTKYIGVQI